MANVRIYEIATELGYSSKEIIQKAQEMGLKKIKSASNAVSNEEAAAIYDYVQTGAAPKKSKSKTTKKEKPEKIIKKTDVEAKEEKVEKIIDEISGKTSKKEAKVENKKVIEEKTTAKISEPKPQPKIVEKIKEKPVEMAKEKDIRPKESQTTPPFAQKRRGIVIVKRRDEQEPQPQAKSQSKKTQIEPTTIKNIGLETIFSNAEANLKRKKKEKKQPPVTKRENATKMEILSDREISDRDLEDDDIVVLPDFTDTKIKVEKKEPKKQLNILKGSQSKAFSNIDGGISRTVRKRPKRVQKEQPKEQPVSIEIPKDIRVYEFAQKLNKQSSEIIQKLFLLGMLTTKNDFLDEDAIEILADEFKVDIKIVDETKEFDYVTMYDETKEDPKDLVVKAPVITIMGHVDHGKTSLLDYIRNSRVATGEAGGITQHVGAYMVNKNGRNITFIDTPGHEAFTSMRARGAGVTDIVIIIVAADDGVKPQTKEAVAHAKAAGVPIIIAINKMDKENANPDLVKTGLSELDIMPVEWGGNYEFVPISAKTGQGIDELLEIVLLQADILELKANPKRAAKATVIEGSLQKGRGPVATVIVENGTLRVGDTVVAGVAYGKIRAITDDKQSPMQKIAPGECGVVVGLSDVPEAGDTLIAVKSDKEAREYAKKRHDYLRQIELSKSTKVTIDELSQKIKEGELKSLSVVLKADVQGTLEALKTSLEKLKNEEIKVDIIHSGVGGITQNDVDLASASQNCMILGFNVRPIGEVRERAKERGVEIKTYSVIYSLIDDVKNILSGLMSPIIHQEELGQAEIREVINVPRIGQIAGCMVTDGVILRGAKIRVIRGGVVVFEGNISSLKRFKDDVKEVAKGYECGVGIEGYNDMQVGDYIESFREKEERAQI